MHRPFFLRTSLYFDRPISIYIFEHNFCLATNFGVQKNAHFYCIRKKWPVKKGIDVLRYPVPTIILYQSFIKSNWAKISIEFGIGINFCQNLNF